MTFYFSIYYTLINHSLPMTEFSACFMKNSGRCSPQILCRIQYSHSVFRPGLSSCRNSYSENIITLVPGSLAGELKRSHPAFHILSSSDSSKSGTYLHVSDLSSTVPHFGALSKMGINDVEKPISIPLRQSRSYPKGETMVQGRETDRSVIFKLTFRSLPQDR